MKKDITILRENLIGADSLSVRNGVYTARRGYYHSHGKDSNDFAALIENRVNEIFDGKKVFKLVEHGDHWAPFKAGAPVARQCHWWVKFSIVA